MSASSQLSCPPDANSAVVYKTAALPARTLCTPVSSGVPARPAQGHGLATDPGHSFAARDRVANVRRSSSVSRTTTGKGIRDSGLQTASFILPAPDRTASPFGADSDWRTGMADMCAVHDAPRLIVLEHRVGDLISYQNGRKGWLRSLMAEVTARWLLVKDALCLSHGAALSDRPSR